MKLESAPFLLDFQIIRLTTPQKILEALGYQGLSLICNITHEVKFCSLLRSTGSVTDLTGKHSAIYIESIEQYKLMCNREHLDICLIGEN